MLKKWVIIKNISEIKFYGYISYTKSKLLKNIKNLKEIKYKFEKFILLLNLIEVLLIKKRFSKLITHELYI